MGYEWIHDTDICAREDDAGAHDAPNEGDSGQADPHHSKAVRVETMGHFSADSEGHQHQKQRK
ncbi:hypothetical protein GCM10022207_94570 [Streptomyces lannensis]|uniref:Uncharacterized protein n=1 Tax=Streptomyces lannensis TaxID=766498 RepID=A0ABP7M1W1_9ACTN